MDINCWLKFIVRHFFKRSAHHLQLRPKSINHDLDLDISILMEKKFIHTYIHFNYFSVIRPCLLEIYRLTFVALIICCWLFLRSQYQYIKYILLSFFTKYCTGKVTGISFERRMTKKKNGWMIYVLHFKHFKSLMIKRKKPEKYDAFRNVIWNFYYHGQFVSLSLSSGLLK